MKKRFLYKKKKIIGILVVAFMLATSIGTIIQFFPAEFGVNANTAGNNGYTPSLSSVGETGSAYIDGSYYTNTSVANSGTTTVHIPILQNSSYSTYSFGTSKTWNSISSTSAYTIQGFSGAPAYVYFSSSDVIELDSVAFELGFNLVDGKQYTLGTVYANLTLDGVTMQWVHTFNYYITTSSYYYAIITPSYVLADYNFNGGTGYAVVSNANTASLNITATSGGTAYSGLPTYLFTTTVDQGQNVIYEDLSVSAQSVPFVDGYYYGSTTPSLGVPNSETYFEVSWSSSVDALVTYFGYVQTGTSGTFGGFAKTGDEDSICFTTSQVSSAIPSAGNTVNYYVDASFYLSDQYQAVNHKFVNTYSPSYTYSQVSGTTNQASASYSISSTTPSGDIYTDYGGTLYTTFSPVVNFTNPYYTYKQNELNAAITGSTSVNSNTSSIQDISCTVPVYSETSAHSPSWTVSLDLYGNVAPSVDSYNAKWTGSSDNIELWFNATQNTFNNETLQLSVNWGNGNISTFTSTNTYGTSYGFVEYYQYSQVGSYTITATISNEPNPSNNYLLSLSNSTIMSKTYTISISPSVKQASTGNILPSGSVLQQSEAINVYFSAVNDIVNTLKIYENDGSGNILVGTETFNTASGEFSDIKPSYEGVFSFALSIVFDGANATFTYNYAAPYYPANLSNYVTTYYSNSASQLTSTNYKTLQVHYWDYNYANAYASNLSEWLYQYDIPNNKSDFVRINFNDTWLFYSASVPVYGSVNDSNGSVILNSTNWDTVQLELLEPITIANPLGELTISYAPSTALAQIAGVKIPFSELTTYVNGKVMVADNYQYIVGSALSIKTVDIFNQTVASYNLTPTSQVEDLQIEVPFAQMQFANLNSTYYVAIFVKQNGIPQALTSVLPLQTVTIYIPDGSYNFSFQFHAISNDVIMPSNYYKVMSVDGLGVYFFKGVLFYGINQNLNTTKANLSSLLTNITIVIDANNSIVSNLITKINVDLNANNSNISKLLYDISDNTTIINSNITHLLLQMETNFTFVHDLINDVNISFTSRMTFLNDTVKTLNLNETTYYNITHDIVSSINLTESQRYQMEADAGAFAYHFVPKNETTNSTGIFVTSWLENAADKPVDNKTLVYEVWKNLTVAYINLTDNKLISPHLISYNSYSITIFLPLNATQLYNLQNDSGKTELSMYSPFVLNSASNIATGNINPSNAIFVNTTTVPWYVGLVADYYPPYSSNPLQEIENILVWILDNAGGRALTLLVGLGTLAYFAYMINKNRKDKGEKKWRYRVEKKMDRIYRKVVGES